jgi:hypothetical protein
MADKVTIEIDVTDQYGRQEAQDCLKILDFRCALEAMDNRMRRFQDESDGDESEVIYSIRQIFFDVLEEYGIELWVG